MTGHAEVREMIFQRISLIAEWEETLSDDSVLMEPVGPLDSFSLITLCLSLEDLGSELAFQFDWVSENAMSRSRGIFRTAGSLADEFIAQMEPEL